MPVVAILSVSCTGVNNCSGHGNCTGTDICVCEDGYYSADCSSSMYNNSHSARDVP